MGARAPLTHATGALAGAFHARATTATIRTHLINVPARLGPLGPASDSASARALALATSVDNLHVAIHRSLRQRTA
ncbi:MAG: hypothetical protein ACRDTG_13010 [Pseudonocardiaceae bacterium]